ncbi:LysM peptidoglycan-binding domain-containing protein [Roseateles depolymerans]|uniref:Putative signal peptide protein n=1 Tax=Roseateles depolymerans TaxID=76731 RepID=A0A0U3LAN0_9BURK|nr:LysM domain-containing protein [Roseateles depolymerans]ALV05103.1 Putative signal peptide protein [Roseateles depolymerans]REG14883.1 LysM domain-containing protein [Roseateles depolymerans]
MTQRRPLGLTTIYAALLAGALISAPALAAGDYPITPKQRETAQKVAQAGVPLSELAPNAPDTYTVKRGDTLWAISSLFLKSPWRWPELWGMNDDQIKNPHLIYPGQVLVLVKADGRARLQLGRDVTGGTNGDVKLSPRVRSTSLDDGSIASIPQHLIEPFLNEAIVLNTDELATAPRIVAAQENRVWMTKGELAYARGEFTGDSEYRIFRKAKPLVDPVTKEVLGYEAAYVGTADVVRPGSNAGGAQEVPTTLKIGVARQEVGVGDRLAPIPARGYTSYMPHAPSGPVDGLIVSVYGDAINAGQNQIVALNRGSANGMEKGHVLALWRTGRVVRDGTTEANDAIRLPDERHGSLFVFQVFDRVSYALVLTVQEPVTAGDRFTQP